MSSAGAVSVAPVTKPNKCDRIVFIGRLNTCERRSAAGDEACQQQEPQQGLESSASLRWEH